MNASDMMTLLPILIPSLTAVLVMLLIAFYRSYFATVLMTCIGLAASLAILPATLTAGPKSVTPLLLFDNYSAVYIGLLLAPCAVTVLLSYGYLKTFSGNREEYYLLLLLATVGALVLVTSNHFAAFFLGFEILSVSLYALIAYPHQTDVQVEAGLKYLILAAVSSTFLIFGLALVYAGTGSLDFSETARLLRQALVREDNVILLTGIGMAAVGMAFKLALVPFHFWTPDVYQGAPAPVTGFIATVSKGSIIALMVRFFFPADFYPDSALAGMFGFLAVVSMFAGNLLALMQNNVKRILAYSSIAHIGYIMVAFLSGGHLAKTAVAFYLLVYFATTLSAFGVITVLSSPGRENESIEDYRGLLWKRPWLGGIFMVSLLSLAGIPLTAGFMGKFYLVASGIETSRWALVITLILTSTIGLFYYLRIIGAMIAREPEETAAPSFPSLSVSGWLLLAGIMVFLIFLGLAPGAVINLIQIAAAG